MNYWTQSNENIYVAAHRGLCAKYPENTMPAFIAAAKSGVDQIETDVRITSDGTLVIMHDETVDRTTDGSGIVREMTLSQIKSLDAGIKKGEEFKGERVPTFKEFMDFVKEYDIKTLDIELKEYPVEGRDEFAYATCDKIIDMIEEYGYGERVVLNTFSGKLHEYIYNKYGGKYRQHVYYPISYMGKGMTKNPLEYAYCCCVFRSWINDGPDINMGTRDEFSFFKDNGVQPWAGAGVKDEETVAAAVRNGATLITCNNCDEVLEILRKMGRHK